MAEAAVTALCLLIVAGIFVTDKAWVDRHFLPDFLRPHDAYVRAVRFAHGLAAALAALLFFVIRPWAARLAAGRSALQVMLALAPSLVAVVASAGAAELVLRTPAWRVATEIPKPLEPRLIADPRLGWTFAPSHTGYRTVGGRRVAYSFDARGYRAPSPDAPPPFEAPAIVFTGKSIIAGHGLNWSETVAARVQAATGVASACVAVNGYSPDQAYLRLTDELPKFRRPVAVVAVFAPSLFAKHINPYRPHLGNDLAWRPADGRWRLVALLDRFVRYRSDAQIDAGVALQRAALAQTVAAARRRGAKALVVVPEFGPEDPASRMIRRRVLDEGHIPYVVVTIDPAWRIPDDGHPDPRGAQAMADAVVRGLALTAEPPSRADQARAREVKLKM